MVDVIVLGIIQAEVYMLMYTYGTELGALLLIPASVLTLAPMLLIAYCYGCVERFFHNRRAAIEAARPAPLLDADRNARALSDRADPHIAVVDVPNLLVGFGIGRRVSAGMPHDSPVPPGRGSR
jgi:hypothetical protein